MREPSTTFYGVFDNFSMTYEVTKFPLIKLCPDVSDVSTQMNIRNYQHTIIMSLSVVLI